MKNNIKIITPFYNPGEFLETCVNTLMSQKYDSFKVIFVFIYYLYVYTKL